MNTATKMEANPIHVKIASFPSVRMLAASAVQMAAMKVQTIEHTLPLARIFRPWASPRRLEPVAKL